MQYVIIPPVSLAFYREVANTFIAMALGLPAVPASEEERTPLELAWWRGELFGHQQYSRLCTAWS